jgi:hypothetical protein
MPSNYHPRNPRGQQRDKLYREALRMELAAAGEDLRELREIAKAHIAKCKEGDMQAIKELADRLDGKPTQLLEHTEGAQPTTMRKLTYEIVHVTKTQEQIENEDLVVDFHEIKNGNGHDPAN